MTPTFMWDMSPKTISWLPTTLPRSTMNLVILEIDFDNISQVKVGIFAVQKI